MFYYILLHTIAWGLLWAATLGMLAEESKYGGVEGAVLCFLVLPTFGMFFWSLVLLLG